MWQFFLASWRGGFRSRALVACALLGIGLVFIAYLSASFSMRQVRTVALDVGLSGLRLCLILIAITLVQDLVGREIERRSVVFSLAYPASRGAYLLGRFFGVAALAAVAMLILALLLWLAVMIVGGAYEQEFRVHLGWPFWVAALGIWLDAMVVASFAVLVSTVSTVSVLPLAAGLAFAVAGKAFGPLVDYINRGASGQPELVSTYRPMIEVAQWVIPDLSRLDWRMWPMYGLQPDLLGVVLSVAVALLYSAAMLSLSVWLFSRREFA